MIQQPIDNMTCAVWSRESFLKGGERIKKMLDSPSPPAPEWRYDENSGRWYMIIYTIKEWSKP